VDPVVPLLFFFLLELIRRRYPIQKRAQPSLADPKDELEGSFDENRADPMSLGDKPLMVLTAGSVQTEGTGLSQEQADQLDELHSESQAALARRSENAKQIIAEDSGHYIHVERPDLVIDAIRRVVEAARTGSRL
jgi:hypothetical protein